MGNSFESSISNSLYDNNISYDNCTINMSYITISEGDIMGWNWTYCYDITLSYANCEDCKYHKYDSEEDKTYCLRPTKWSGFEPKNGWGRSEK